MSKGLKRICMNCGARFYDLDKIPIVCPTCETEFTGEIKVKTRRGRVPIEEIAAAKEAEVKKPEPEEEEEVEEIDADDDIVSLDDVDEDGLDDDENEDDGALSIDDDLEDNLDDLDEDDDEEEDK